MTALARQARDASLSCEAKKHAYRQTQDGVVVSFVLHPNDVPDALAVSPLGTRYMVALVEIGDDEQPVNRKGGAHEVEQDQDSSVLMARPRSDEPRLIGAARRIDPDRRLAQRAGILCADPVFQRFAVDELSAQEQSEVAATEALRACCNVDSRRDIKPNTEAARIFDRVYSRFIAWRDAP